MDNSGIRRHDGEISEARLPPAQEPVTLLVAQEFQLCIQAESLCRAKFVDLYRMIDHQFSRLQWIDQGRIAAQPFHSIAHGCEIDHGGHASEVLEQHSAGSKGNFFVRPALAVPSRQRANFLLSHIASVFGSQQVFQQYTERKGQVPGGNALLVEGIYAIDFVLLTPCTKGRAALKTVHRHDAVLSPDDEARASRPHVKLCQQRMPTILDDQKRGLELLSLKRSVESLIEQQRVQRNYDRNG